MISSRSKAANKHRKDPRHHMLIKSTAGRMSRNRMRRPCRCKPLSEATLENSNMVDAGYLSGNQALTSSVRTTALQSSHVCYEAGSTCTPCAPSAPSSEACRLEEGHRVRHHSMQSKKQRAEDIPQAKVASWLLPKWHQPCIGPSTRCECSQNSSETAIHHN
jgi:hypothetical protein